MPATQNNSDVRLTWIRLIVKATSSAQGKNLRDDKVEEISRISLPRFSHIATEDFSDVFDLGQKCQAESLDDFLAVWQIELESRAREAEIARRRAQAETEQARLLSPHPNRDAFFAKWGFA